MAPSDNSEQQQLVEALPDAEIQLAFAWKDAATQWTCAQVPILQDVATQFREIATRPAEDLLQNRAEVAYNPEWPLTSAQFFAISNPRASLAVGGDLFPQLDNFAQLPAYGSLRRQSNPNVYVVLAQLGDESLAMFGRRITARSLIGRKRIKFLWDNETLSSLEGPVITFDSYFDWIEWRETLLVLNGANFHLTFRDVAALRAAVQAHVDEIGTRVEIQNADALVERCRAMPSMAAKLDSVVQQRHFEKPIADLKSYSTRYPGLGVEWDGDALVFDASIEKQFAILKLLDEAGYTGDLSGEQFEAAGKRRI